MTGIDLAEEDAAWLRYLMDNGWDGDVGSSDDETHLVGNISKARKNGSQE